MDNLKRARAEIDRVDREMAALFCRRMEAVREIAAYKQAHGLPVADVHRETEILSQNASLVIPELRPLYAGFQQGVMEISKQLQTQLKQDPHAIRVDLGLQSYDVIAERGCLSRASELTDLNRRVLIVTDDGVPAQYAQTVAKQCQDARIYTLPQGEVSKSFSSLQSILSQMTAFSMLRTDCVVAVGGGMVGDLAGLAASLYMRGVDFYNIPTTLLSQVDSSVGGKTAIDFGGIKNTVGTFYQPKRVLVDPDVLADLSRRQLAAGLAEGLKMAVTLDPTLFALFEQNDPLAHLDEIIVRCIAIKARVVAADQREHGVRRVLNFGHTIGHAVESAHPELLHGECVALGMLPMCDETVRERLLPIYRKLCFSTCCEVEIEKVKTSMEHDKKRTGGEILVVEVPEIGQYVIRPATVEELAGRLQIIARGA